MLQLSDLGDQRNWNDQNHYIDPEIPLHTELGIKNLLDRRSHKDVVDATNKENTQYNHIHENSHESRPLSQLLRSTFEDLLDNLRESQTRNSQVPADSSGRFDLEFNGHGAFLGRVFLKVMYPRKTQNGPKMAHQKIF